ncbi:MAG TPA: AAA family ATPase [Candidatus Saccharimonadales bacterium]|nr:AAA family ATPase [Candidatus Saccharimonadales bacterium]
MNRVLIVGAPGSGKSTLARALQAKTGLPITHLDTYYFDPKEHYQKHKAAWLRRVEKLAAEDKWIIEGCHVTTFAKETDRSDVTIFLDYSRRVIICRLIKRSILQGFRDPPEMPEGWREVYDTKARRWIFNYVLNFRRTFRTELAELLAAGNNKQRLIFRHPKEAEAFLRTQK